MMVRKGSGKLSNQQQRQVADQFFQYLEARQLTAGKIYAKPELKSIFENKFRKEATNVLNRNSVAYARILFVLARFKPIKLYVKNGYVSFKKTQKEKT